MEEILKKSKIMKLNHFHFLFPERQRLISLDALPDDELRDFDVRLRIILRKHITVLGWWGVLNCIVGLTAFFMWKGFMHYFGLMSAVWGIINFAVTLALFNHIFYLKFHQGSAYQRLIVQSHIERVLLLNVGIDTAYIFVGFWLREHSFVREVLNPELWLGFGWAIVFQGLFLMVLDSVFFILHWRNFRKAKPFLKAKIEGKY